MSGDEERESFEGIRVVGVVSDTHGRLRPSLFDRLGDVGLVLHAGDVVEPAHLNDLGALAPVRAVWGNMDGQGVRSRLPEACRLVVNGVPVGMWHGHRGTGAEALVSRFPGARILVHGHTHEPRWERVGDAVILNPGSAGPRRPGKPVTAARLLLGGDEPRVEFLDLRD
jgi:putative phosphoesterase